MSAARLLILYRLIFCALIAIAGVQTLAAAPQPAHHTAALAAAETGGALLLSWRRTQWAGAAALLVVFACAQAISAAAGSYPTRFLQYAASSLLIVGMDRALATARRPW
jgi:hypothetical protein